jgi:energy-coupling factor transporter ATP-binding protein EcfA2
MTGQIPIVQLNVESMRFTMQQAFSKHLLDMDKMFQHAIEQACRPENVQAVLQDAAERFLRETVEQEVKNFFAYGPGREEVKGMVERALTKPENPLPKEPPC